MRYVVFRMYAFRRILAVSRTHSFDPSEAYKVWAMQNGMTPQLTLDGYVTTRLNICDEAKFRKCITELILNGTLEEEDFETE